MQKVSHQFTVIIEPAEEGGYIVTVPFLGITTEGDTLKQARNMAEDAITGYLECLQEDGQPIPKEPAKISNNVFVEKIDIQMQ